MSDKLTSLLRENKIDKYEFDTYLLFEGNELGRQYLKNMLDAIVLEEPDYNDNLSYARVEGKRLVWRNIKMLINRINYMIEGTKHDKIRASGIEPIRTFDPPNFG